MSGRLNVPEDVLEIISCLENGGFEAYVVGGAVRDRLAHREPKDYDLCTNASPEQIKSACSAWRTVDTGIKHGTVSVLTGRRKLEITSFREGAQTIEDDLSKRDLTLNAMAWSPKEGIIDPFGGQRDLQNGVLRFVGSPRARIDEDALRILRAVRFLSENGYTAEPETKKALFEHRAKLRYCAAERITAELIRILCGEYVGEILREYDDIITEILPELRPMIGFSQNNPHHKYTLWEHSVRAVEAIAPVPTLRLAMLFHDLGKTACYTEDSRGIGHFYGHANYSVPLTMSALCRLRLENTMYDDVLHLVRHHDTPMGQDAATVRRKLAVHGEKYYRWLLAVHKADCIGQGTSRDNLPQLVESERIFEEVLTEEGIFHRADLAVDGNDLKSWGFRGTEIGEALAALSNYVLDDPRCNTKQNLKERLSHWKKRSEHMEFTVSGMSWSYCAREVRAILEKLPSVDTAAVDLSSGRVDVTGTHISLKEIRQVLAKAGYKVAI